MNNFMLIIICVGIAALLQFLLCKSDSILNGLIVPAFFTVLGLFMAFMTAGNAVNKINVFLQWFIPGAVALVMYFYVKRAKIRKKKAMKEAARKLEEEKKMQLEQSSEEVLQIEESLEESEE